MGDTRPPQVALLGDRAAGRLGAHRPAAEGDLLNGSKTQSDCKIRVGGGLNHPRLSNVHRVPKPSPPRADLSSLEQTFCLSAAGGRHRFLAHSLGSKKSENPRRFG